MISGRCPIHDQDKAVVSERNRRVALAAAKSPHRRQKLSEWGRRGYDAAVAKHGRMFGLLRQAEYLRVNLSGPEQFLAEILDRMGIKHKSQYVWANEKEAWIVDEANKRERWVIQIDGWRTCEKPFGRTDCGGALEYLEKQLAYIREYGWRALYIDAVGKSPEAIEEEVRRFFSD